jgi:hypothetical protein
MRHYPICRNRTSPVISPSGRAGDSGGAGRFLGRLPFRAESRLPAPEGVFPLFIEHPSPDLQEQVRPTRAPAHPAAGGKPRRRPRSPRAAPPGFRRCRTVRIKGQRPLQPKVQLPIGRSSRIHSGNAPHGAGGNGTALPVGHRPGKGCRPGAEPRKPSHGSGSGAGVRRPNRRRAAGFRGSSARLMSLATTRRRHTSGLTSQSTTRS